MDPIEFLKWDELLAIHHRQLELFGGQDGFTDRGIVESAFHRPQWAAAYSEPDFADLAAEYLYGLATTQGFCDGNKRTATQCAVIFLERNGYRLNICDDELFPIAHAVAVGSMDRDALADWIAGHLVARD